MAEPMALPSELREAVRRDLAPVRPLLPPILRASGVWLISLAVATLLVSALGVRHDLSIIPSPAFWIPLVLRSFAGLLLVALAIRDAVPSLGASSRVRWMAVLFGLGMLILLPVVFARVMNATEVAPGAEDLLCYRIESAIAAPSFLLAWWLVIRGYPVRPLFAMIAAGLGIGLLADATLFAACAIHGQKHWLLAHSGAVLTYALLGAAAGALIGRLRRRNDRASFPR